MSTRVGSNPQPIDLLIDARWIIPVYPAGCVLEDHSVAVRDGRIVAVLPRARAQAAYLAAERVSLPRQALIPGLVNLHTHAAMDRAHMHLINHRDRCVGFGEDRGHGGECARSQVRTAEFQRHGHSEQPGAAEGIDGFGRETSRLVVRARGPRQNAIRDLPALRHRLVMGERRRAVYFSRHDASPQWPSLSGYAPRRANVGGANFNFS